MTGDLDAGAPDKASLDGSPRVVLTVRLYLRGHELLVAEFENLGRRRRAARAAQLMMVGLMYERAHLSPRSGMPVSPPPTVAGALHGPDFGLAPTADAFISAVLRSSGDASLEIEPGTLCA